MVVELVPNFFETAGALGWWVSLALILAAAYILLNVAIVVLGILVVVFAVLFSFIMAFIDMVTP